MRNEFAHALLTPDRMALADRAAIRGGIPGKDLMAAAGAAVAQAIEARWTPRTVLVLCGPGNNGGDGFIAACHLQQAGWPVRVALWGDRTALRGDAAWAAQQWSGPVEPAVPQTLENAELIVDALLGAGLSRAPAGALAKLLQAAKAGGLPVCAIDVPTGLDGATGACPGPVLPADLTVTFFRRKPAHLLLPGRVLCGRVLCVDIGIPENVLQSVAPVEFANHPDLWMPDFPWPQLDDHKYRRGHVLVIGGATLPGATRLASLAAARSGAGLVTLAVPQEIWAVQAAALSAVMVQPLNTSEELSCLLQDTRYRSLLIGPGLGRQARAREQVLTLLDSGLPCVLDADAISCFAAQPHELLGALHPACVLTPHEGEFQRLFELAGDKLARSRAAAVRSGAVVVLKGADTVIAQASGRVVINDNAPATLATAGSGDVLAGCVAGLLATGMPAFQAACAAVWLHGAAASLFGPGLIADDLPLLLARAQAQLAP